MTDIAIKKADGTIQVMKADDSAYITKEEAEAFLERRQHYHWPPLTLTRKEWAGALRSARRTLRDQQR